MLVCAATLFFQPLTGSRGLARGLHSNQGRRPPTTMGGTNDHHTRSDFPQSEARKLRCADRAGKRTDQTIIGIRRPLAARQRTTPRSLFETSFAPATKGISRL